MHVQLPAVGKQVKAGEVVCEVESVKAVAEIYSPATGKVVLSTPHLKTPPSRSTPTLTAVVIYKFANRSPRPRGCLTRPPTV